MTVVGCTGHQQLPPEAQAFVRAAVATEVGRHDPAALTGVCSLAVGADQIFAAAVLAAGAALHVVVPCTGYETTFAPADRRRYDELRAAARAVEVLPFPAPSEDAFLAAGRSVVDAADVLVAVWDGSPARGRGGTADVVGYAREGGVPVERIWPAGVTR